jgi:hypothetical protein
VFGRLRGGGGKLAGACAGVAGAEGPKFLRAGEDGGEVAGRAESERPMGGRGARGGCCCCCVVACTMPMSDRAPLLSGEGGAMRRPLLLPPPLLIGRWCTVRSSPRAESTVLMDVADETADAKDAPRARIGASDCTRRSRSAIASALNIRRGSYCGLARMGDALLALRGRSGPSACTDKSISAIASGLRIG